MSNLGHDVRYSLRMLRKSPGFTAVALITLALGIGGNTAIFSVVDRIVLQPLDYTNPDRIVRLQTSWASEPDAYISPAEYFGYRDQLDTFSAMGVYAFSSTSIAGDDRPERLRGGLLYGVAPLDAATFIAVPLILGAAAMLAAWMPTRRATRVDPTVVLRHE